MQNTVGMISNYLFGPADPVIRCSAAEIGLSLKAAILTRPRIILQPASVLDSQGMQDILYKNEMKPAEVGIETIRKLTSSTDRFSLGKPILSLATHEELKNGNEHFEAWSGIHGRLRKDPVYSSTLSEPLDPNMSLQEVLRLVPRFKVGVDAIDNIFIRNAAVEKATVGYQKDFRPALEESLKNYVEGGGKPELNRLSNYLLSRIEETEDCSRSFIIRECEEFVGQDIYSAKFTDSTYRAFREALIDQNWRFSHAKAIKGNSWESFQEKISVFKRVFSHWHRSAPLENMTFELPYAGRYLSETSVEDILKLRTDEDYLKQLRAIQWALQKSKTGKLSKEHFEVLLQKLAEAFPSSKGKSPKQKLVKIAAISACIGWGADIGVRTLSTLLVNTDPDAILLGDLAGIGSSIASAAIIGISSRASETPPLKRDFKAFGMRLVEK